MTSVGVQGKQLERALVISGTWLHSSNWCCLPYEACLDILQRVSGGDAFHCIYFDLEIQINKVPKCI